MSAMTRVPLVLSILVPAIQGACSLPTMQVKPDVAAGALRPFEQEAFGTGGENHVRFNLGTRQDVIEDAVRRMGAVA